MSAAPMTVDEVPEELLRAIGMTRESLRLDPAERAILAAYQFGRVEMFGLWEGDIEDILWTDELAVKYGVRPPPEEQAPEP